MTRPHKVGAALTFLILVAIRAAAADPAPVAPPAPVFHLPDPSTLTTHGGAVLTLPPGYFSDEPSWAKIDAAKKADQDAITRLTAENKSFRVSAADWKPTWWILASAAASGIVIGWYAHAHL